MPNLLEIGAILAASGLVGAVSVPALRKSSEITEGAVRFLRGGSDIDFFGKEIDLDCIAEDLCTVRCQSGVVSHIWTFGGASFDATTEEAETALLARRTSFLRALGKTPKVHARFFALRRRRALSLQAAWPSASLQEIGQAEKDRWTAGYVTDWYFVLSALSLQALTEAGTDLKSMLKDFGPRLLKSPEDPTAPCEITGFLNGLVCGDYRHDLPRREHLLSFSLPGSDMDFDRDGSLYTTGVAPFYHRVVAVREWPEQVSGILLRDLLSINGDIEISQIVEPIGREAALLSWNRDAGLQQSMPFFRNATRFEESAAIVEMLNQGTISLFTTQFQISVRGTTLEDADRLVNRVREILSGRGVSFSVERTALPKIWFARLPAMTHSLVRLGHLMVRPLFLREENIAALWTFAKSSTGAQASPFGAQPVRVFPTVTGDAYRFQFHVSAKEKALGHFMVIAPSGGGKSTLLMYLLSGLAKFEGVRSIVFDSKDGARFMIEALGGFYQNYDSLALNPLDVGADTPAARQRIMHMLRALCGTLALTPEDQAELEAALPFCFDVEPPHRTFNTLYGTREYELAMFRKGSNLHRHFAKWVSDEKGNVGQHAHVFNSPQDSLGSLVEQFLVGINMNEALEDPELGPPIVAHISAALARSAAQAGKGFAIFIDEAAKLLQNRGFEDLAAEMFREYRRLGGVVGMAFQDPAALAQSRHAAAFIENIATLIILPNANAKAESFAPFNLNQEHLDFATGRLVVPGRPALIVKNDAVTGHQESVIINVDLSWLNRGMRFFRGGVDATRDMQRLKAKEGEQWREHLPT